MPEMLDCIYVAAVTAAAIYPSLEAENTLAGAGQDCYSYL